MTIDLREGPAPGAGYDPGFLGVEVPLPLLAAARTVELPYTHFTVLLRPDRRLAAATAVVIDGARLRDLERGDEWRLDPRVPAQEQVGPELYTDNDLDRGHLVRRRDPVWGSDAEARRANADTFHYTNAAPQAADFNQDEELWLGLENYLLDHARVQARRLVVLTGPVLDPADPFYRGVQVPLRFWKVAAFVQDGGLAATGYVLDQTPLVDDLERRTARADDEPPPLGPYRTFQVPVAEVAAITGLDLGPLPDADRLPVPVPAAGASAAAGASGAPSAWRRLTSHDDVASGA